MAGNDVQLYTSQGLPPCDDSGMGVTAESTPCTQDIQQGEERDDIKVIYSETRLCSTAYFDPIRKKFVIRCHQENCIHTEHCEEARGESTTDEGSEKLPVECSNKCHQGVLVVSRRFWLVTLDIWSVIAFLQIVCVPDTWYNFVLFYGTSALHHLCVNHITKLVSACFASHFLSPFHKIVLGTAHCTLTLIVIHALSLNTQSLPCRRHITCKHTV